MLKRVTLFASLMFLSSSYTAEPASHVCADVDTITSEIELALGNIDTEKITVPKLQYKGFITPSELRNYSSEALAEALIDRIENGCDKIRGGDEETTVAEHSEVMLLADMGLWDSIGLYGFQNQHVTATTGGCDCREMRYQAETKMIGSMVGYSSKSKDILPKYSGLNVLAKNHLEDSFFPSAPITYGNSAVVFKNSINSRTTFSPWDSLATREFRGSPILSSMSFRDKKDHGYKCDFIYCEAQVWGKLTLDDVSYALIPEGSEVPQAFKDKNIPVYFIKQGTKGSMAWEKGEIAYAPRKSAVLKQKRIPSSCVDCNSVEKKINDHHNFSKDSVKELKAQYEIEEQIDQKRELLGELATRDFKGKSSYFKKQFEKAIEQVLPPYLSGSYSSPDFATESEPYVPSELTMKTSLAPSAKWPTMPPAPATPYTSGMGTVSEAAPYGEGGFIYSPKVFKVSRDPISAAVSLQALSEFSYHREVKEIVISVLKDKNPMGIGAVHYLALSMATELEDLKNKPDIKKAVLSFLEQNKIKEGASTDPYFNQNPKYLLRFHQYLTTSKTMCDEVPENYLEVLKEQYEIEVLE